MTGDTTLFCDRGAQMIVYWEREALGAFWALPEHS